MNARAIERRISDFHAPGKPGSISTFGSGLTHRVFAIVHNHAPTVGRAVVELLDWRENRWGPPTACASVEAFDRAERQAIEAVRDELRAFEAELVRAEADIDCATAWTVNTEAAS